MGSYRPLVTADRVAYLSGQVSKTADGTVICGKLGQDLSPVEGQHAARTAALNVLSVIDSEVGFERVKKLLRVVGYVQCIPSFYEISQVVNGASDLFLEFFGEKGIHARSAVGIASLPLNAAVEIEATLLLKS